MKILIPLFTPSTGNWGGLTRMLAIADAANAEGHSVAFCAAGSLRSLLEKRGYRMYSLPAPVLTGALGEISALVERDTIPSVQPGQDFGNTWYLLMISGLARAGYLQRLVTAELQAARDWGAQAIFTELDPAAFLVSQIENLPIAAAYQTPMVQGIGTLPWRLLNGVVGSIQRDYHLPAQTIDVLCHGPRVLKVLPSIPDLEGADPIRRDVRYVGSLLGAIESAGVFHPEPGRRYVFAYVGTGSVPMELLREVLPKAFPWNGDLICLVAAQNVLSVERLGNVEFRPYTPAGEVLPYCDWTLCHGGQNTIIQSLMYGVPLLMFPGPVFERRFNARKVQAAGAGCMGELPDFTPQWIQSALERRHECTAQARLLGVQLGSYGGAREAIRALEEWGRSDHLWM
jgi:hypothetical protein